MIGLGSGWCGHQIWCNVGGLAKGQRAQWAWDRGFLGYGVERWGRNAQPASFFDWGFWGVLTKNRILCYDLHIYYFLICYACENIENIFIFFVIF